MAWLCVCKWRSTCFASTEPHTPQTTVNQQMSSSFSLHGFTNYLQGKMKQLVWLSILLCLFVCHLSDGRVIPEGVPYDEPPAVPYWPYSTSDFWNYIEYFKSIGAYNHINEMARAFYAHQPIGDTLGYETNEGHEH